MQIDLSGKVALVTGASGDLGRVEPDVPTNPSNTRNPTTRTPRRPRQILTVVLCGLLISVITIIGIRWNQLRAEEVRLKAIRTELKKIVLANNALTLEILDMGMSSRITYAEFFKGAESNREERNNLIRQIRSIEPGPYSHEVQKFIRLMEVEIEFVRSEEALLQGKMELSVESKALKEAIIVEGQASEQTSNAMFVQTQNSIKIGLEHYEKALTEMQKKTDVMVVSANEWMNIEEKYYPWVFAPPRKIMNQLISKRNHYADGATQSDEITAVKHLSKLLEILPNGDRRTEGVQKLRIAIIEASYDADTIQKALDIIASMDNEFEEDPTSALTV